MLIRCAQVVPAGAAVTGYTAITFAARPGMRFLYRDDGPSSGVVRDIAHQMQIDMARFTLVASRLRLLHDELTEL